MMRPPCSTQKFNSNLNPGCLLLPGLVLAMLALVPAAGWGAARKEFRPAQNQSSVHSLDEQITSYLNRQYAKHKHLQQVHATVSDRVVTLSGSVANYREFLNANDIARDVSSVSGVVDHLRINAPTVADTTLQNQIAQRLTYSRLGMGQIFNGIKIGVHNGVVKLSGQVVDYPSRDSAAAIAADTKGVKGVVDDIKVAPLSPFDNQIRFAAARAIYRNPALGRYATNPAHPIRILVNNGHVTLWGVVDSKMDKQLAYQAVMSLPNVLGVTNDLVVNNGGGK